VPFEWLQLHKPLGFTALYVTLVYYPLGNYFPHFIFQFIACLPARPHWERCYFSNQLYHRDIVSVALLINISNCSPAPRRASWRDCHDDILVAN